MPERFHWLENEGEHIAAMMHTPDGTGPHPAVLMLHGFSGDRVESHFLFVKTARALARAGLVALRFDFRGSGESEGRFQDVTVEKEVSDALVVLDWLARQDVVDADRIALLGLSMGGCIASLVAGQDRRVKALVLWAAVADPYGLFVELSKNTPLPPPLGPQPDGTIDVGGHLVGPEFFRTLPDANPLAAVAEYSGPALILHGTQDPTVPPRHAEAYKEVLGDRAQLVWVEGADHTFSAHAWEQKAISITRDWLLTHLAARDKR